MSKIALEGNASGTGTLTIAAPNTNSNITFNFPTTLGNAGNSAFVTTDSSGNVGVGVTPSAWLSTYKSIQFSNSSAVFGTTGETLVGTNIFVNSSDENKYITTDEASMYRQSNGNHIFYSAASGTAGNTISFSNVLSVNRNTTLVLQGGTSTSGTGIAFPATQSASSDANTLDDYEEGTWTPSVGGTATYTDRAGTYTKIGDLVYVNCQININTIGTGSTTTISGLPFTSKTGVNRYAGSINYFASLASNAINLLVWNQNGQTIVRFSTVTSSGTGLSSDEASILGNGSWVQFSMCYKAS